VASMTVAAGKSLTLKADNTHWNVLADNSAITFANTAAAALALGDFVLNTYSGAAPSTWTLPLVTGNGGQYFIIKNTGTGVITLNAGAANEIYDNAPTSSIIINPTETYTILNNGIYWITKP